MLDGDMADKLVISDRQARISWNYHGDSSIDWVIAGGETRVLARVLCIHNGYVNCGTSALKLIRHSFSSRGEIGVLKAIPPYFQHSIMPCDGVYLR